MADWTTISSLATAGGTVVLAVATFASVRSANRSARIAEIALQEQRRPVVVNSRADDVDQTIGFADGRWFRVPGGGAAIELADGVVYLAISVRNVGAGIAVMQAWQGDERLVTGDVEPPPIDEFRPHSRDQYVAGSDIGIWQAALRDADDPLHGGLSAAVADRRPFTVMLLYTDQVGGQRTISRFGLSPDDGDGWLAAASRHFYLDSIAPR